ncbi:hypothetical protein [Streptomyces sp. NPDC048442]|uniref:hypothetical protein n=1 Tax=Streptomyces sp. NPDC048442 TaxID=3154823 RepID=UPI003448A5BB
MLLAAGVVLAMLGVILLREPAPQAPPAPRPQAVTPSGAPRGVGIPAPAGAGATGRTAATEPSAPGAGPGVLPAPGEGPQGDWAVQRVLRAAVADDLPPRTARLLAGLGRAVLVAETTGRGRHLWPARFPPGQPVKAFTRVRIQAAAARADGPGRAAVHLVWAGADPAGTYRDGRPATLRFQHIHSAHLTSAPAQGDLWTSWTPTP